MHQNGIVTSGDGGNRSWVRSRSTYARYVAVLEFEQIPGSAPLTLGELDVVLNRLAVHDPAALFNVDRYAIQLVTRATDPSAALATARAAHRESVRELTCRSWHLVRAEIMTEAEFARELQGGFAQYAHWPGREPGASTCAQILPLVHKATREIVAARSRSGVRRAIESYASWVGATIVGDPDDCEWCWPVNVATDSSSSVYVAAPFGSATALLVLDTLPDLWHDARLVLALLGPQPRSERGRLVGAELPSSAA